MADNAQMITTIGPDAIVRGEFTFQSAARILGQVEGKITTSGQLHVGENSVCKASVDASVVVIDGTIEGDVLARERLELSGTAVIHGDICTAKLIVAEGATFTGHCTVSAEAASKPRTESIAPNKNAKPKPRIVAGIGHDAITNGHAPDLDSQLAGLESKLASFTKKASID